MSDPVEKRLEDWEEGIEHFNARRYWDAHECWERGWRELTEFHKLHVQILIQTAGVFELVSRGRPSAAGSLAKSALEKLTRLSSSSAIPLLPRIHVPGLEDALIRIVSLNSAGDTMTAEISRISLRAELVLS